MREVIDKEGPVHLNEAARRLAESAGSRTGPKMRRYIKEAAKYGRTKGLLHLAGDFLFAYRDKPV